MVSQEQMLKKIWCIPAGSFQPWNIECFQKIIWSGYTLQDTDNLLWLWV